MLTKARPAAVKTAAQSAELVEGEFTALVSVFGNRDSQGEVVVKGAFADTLADWKSSGRPIPVIFSHQWDDPDAHIGEVLEATERDDGLWVRGRLDLDEPKAAKVHKLLKGGRINNFSFGFDVAEGGSATVERDGQKVTELRQLRLFEVGPTLVGANAATELLSVKSAKRGRVLSGVNEQALRGAHEAIGSVLAQIAEQLADYTDTEDGAETEKAIEKAADDDVKKPPPRDNDPDDGADTDGADTDDADTDADTDDDTEEDTERPRPPSRRSAPPEKATRKPTRQAPADVRLVLETFRNELEQK